MDRTRHIVSRILGLLWRIILWSMAMATLTFVMIAKVLFISPVKYLFLFLAAAVTVFLCIPQSVWNHKLVRIKKLQIVLIVLIAVLSVPIPLCTLLYHSMTDLSYTAVDSGFFDSSFCQGRTALVVSPHQDDEANMAAPIIEALNHAGSQVYVVYYTAGDYYDQAALRQQEAAAAMADAGVPRDHLFFLGYGDMWQGKHIYDCPPDQALTSYNGKTCTYGSEEFPDFATLTRGTPSLYTRANAVQDMKDCIAYVNPDLIFCADYDLHRDHRATSLFFEEAMGQLLAEKPGWRPQVFKSLSYLTSWETVNDFYHIPLKETQQPQDLGTPSYRWEDRIRFPVPSQFLAYSITEAEYRRIYANYASQGAIYRANNATNSDLVFWERNTDSLLYGLAGEAEGASVLNDFKLFDTSEITSDRYDKGIWRGDSVRFTFREPVSVNCISLWDNPDPNGNILQAELLLSDGSSVPISALDPQGPENEIFFPEKQGITWAELHILRSEGDAGITEMDLACREDRPADFIKLMDGSGNFLYNAPVSPGESVTFSLYAWPPLPENSTFTLTLTGEDFQDIQENLSADALTLRIPSRGTYRVKIQCKEDPRLYDECILYTGTDILKKYLLPVFEEDYLMFRHYTAILAHKYLGIILD